MSRGGVRILGGHLRGRRLPVPATRVRPTEGRVREALAAIWQPRFPGSRFLDLFAGTGAVGVEAVSRGAQWVTFVEHGPKAVAGLRRLRDMVPTSNVVVARLPEGLRRPPTELYDTIFADPPYDFDRYPELLRRAAAWLTPEGELGVEHSSRTDLPATAGPLCRVDQRRWGEVMVSFYRHGELPGTSTG